MQVPDHFDTNKMESSPTKTLSPACVHVDKKMEVENSSGILQQVLEEIKPSQENHEMLGNSTDESLLPPVTPEAIAKMSEIFILVNKEKTCSRKKEQTEANVVTEDTEGGDSSENYETSLLLEAETTPTSESCAMDNSPLGNKSLKSPAEAYSSFPSSVEINKTSVSSSPAASLEFGSSHELLRSQTSSLESSAPFPTYVSLTPKIGMGKPAITKRKFSPGRPRSRQVSMLY